MLTPAMIESVVGPALSEDAPWGDVTSSSLLPAPAAVQATLVARTDGVFAGGAVFAAAFTLTDPSITVTVHAPEGEPIHARDVLATVSGPAAAVLQAERVALNFTQRMSGIATTTQDYVAAVSGTGARIVDTRKTIPGLRVLDRHAVRCGGGHNHRFSLSDAVMVKDNHLAVLAQHGTDLTRALQQLRAQVPHTTHLEVEVDRLDQLEAVLAAGVDSVLLDNFSVADLRAGVGLAAGRALVEASGNVRLDTVRAVAETGVDVISVGALTHSVSALDLGLDIGTGANADFRPHLAAAIEVD